MTIEVETNIDYLIQDLRLHLGDLNPLRYRYLDSWLRTALLMAVKGLSRWWSSKYLVDATLWDTSVVSTGIAPSAVYRNILYSDFEFEADPVIQIKDERPIILMASIIIKSGQLENRSWDLGHWRDAELSYSNIEGGRSQEQSIKRDIEELEKILKPPIKRLVHGIRTSFPEES